MKVSLNGIKDFTEIKLSAEQLIETIGLQLGAVDEVEDLAKKYDGALTVEVIKCIKHPNADKLSLCWVDDAKKNKNVKRDSEGLVQVVCGAPNVKAGMKAVWLPPGMIVPSTADKDPFTLEAREIRGENSNGMLASAKELAIGDNHEGILEVDDNAKPGSGFGEVYKLDDTIIDIENKMFTHRPDLFGMLGVAREIAGIQHEAFKSPDWYKEDIDLMNDGRKNVLPLKIDNKVPKLVPRFSAVAVKDVKVAESPVWLKVYLSKLGIRPISNIVDITNYLMVLTAQPLHAYDYDKILKIGGGEAVLGARLSKKGEKLALLNGKTLELEPGAVLITAGDKAVGLGGVMGGAETEVDESTTSIIIECASFDMNLTRKTAMHYGLFTDASTRFTKNQSSRQNKAVIVKAVSELRKVAGGRVASHVVDDNHTKPGKNVVKISCGFINSRLGLNLKVKEVADLLKNVEFKVDATDENLEIEAPFWRTDIEIAEDIVEEVGRLYGYQHLPLTLPLKDIKPAELNEQFELKSVIRQQLAAAGANEVLTYSFVHSSLLEKVFQEQSKSYHIKNALSPSLQYYRQSLTPSLLEKVHPNVKSGYSKFALFEIGRGRTKGSDKLPKENNLLALVFTSSEKDDRGAAYYEARKYLDFLANNVLNQKLDYRQLKDHQDVVVAPFEPTRSAVVTTSSGEILGVIGEYRSSIISSLKLPKKTAGFEINLDKLQSSRSAKQYYSINKYPETIGDITLKTLSDTSFRELEEAVAATLNKLSDEQGYICSITALDVFQRDDDKRHKHTTFRISLSHPDKTLTTSEANNIFDKIEVSAKQKVKAERV
jgi:phenylalanyl-tRNA synthetase beta chain